MDNRDCQCTGYEQENVTPPVQPGVPVLPVTSLPLYRAVRTEHRRRRHLSTVLMLLAAAVVLYLIWEME